ncbi:hypothetical protein FDECE_2625 [Fusarium decemcellulare]|nr:hypothetical protein FDECE_2625 [Fusarium decemcellulare]
MMIYQTPPVALDIRGLLSRGSVRDHITRPAFAASKSRQLHPSDRFGAIENDLVLSYRYLIQSHLAAFPAYGAAVGHLGQPLYAQVVFVQDVPDRQLWEKMSRHETAWDLRAYLGDHPVLPQPRWVYVAMQDIDLGRFLDGLVKRPEKRGALFVAFYGRRNPIDCTTCTELFMTTIDDCKDHIRSPFWACVSLKGFAGGRCVNCLWRNDQGSHCCEFRGRQERLADNSLLEASPFLLAGSKASTWVSDPALIPRTPDPLTPATCPVGSTPRPLTGSCSDHSKTSVRPQPQPRPRSPLAWSTVTTPCDDLASSPRRKRSCRDDPTATPASGRLPKRHRTDISQ